MTSGRALLGRLRLGRDVDLGVLRRLVRVAHAGELLDLAREGLGVEALDVARWRTPRRRCRRRPRRTRRTPRPSRAPRRGCRRRGRWPTRASTAPARVRRLATQPMRPMLVSRSSLENPRPFDRWVRTTSPSRYSTSAPRLSSSGPTSSAMVVLPVPDRPVNHRVEAACDRSLTLALLRGERPRSMSAVRWWGPRERGHVQPALGLLGVRPAAGARVLARPDRARAVGAADRREALVVERVVGDVVGEQVALARPRRSSRRGAGS